MKPTFSIRTLLLITVVAAICALMIRTSDWVAVLGFAVSAALIMVAVHTFRSTQNRATKGVCVVFLVVAAGVGWFAVVDYSYFHEGCTHCGVHHFVSEHRVCGLAVRSLRGPTHDSYLARLRTDVGMPCQHEYERWHLVRAWGLVYCARPRIGITCCLGFDEEYYNERVSQRAQEFARNNPDAARELLEHIQQHEDDDEMHAFIATMKQPDGVWRSDSPPPSIEPIPGTQ